MKFHIRVQETTSYKYFGFGHVPVIWHNWAKKGPNMGVAITRALVGSWGPGPLKNVVTGPSLLINSYLGNKFHKKNQGEPLKRRHLFVC